MMEVIGPKLGELTAEALDVSIDAITDNEVVKDIPVLGWAVKAASIVMTLRDRLFLAKIHRFLKVAQPTDETRRLAARLASGEEEANRTVEVLLLAIEQINDLEKAPMLARLFTAFLRGEMSAADFRRLTAAVNAAVVDDLQTLAGLGSNPSGSSRDYKDLVEALRHTGLTDSIHRTIVTSDDVNLAEAVTPLGRTFARAVGAGV
jgi:hypothetical protein